MGKSAKNMKRPNRAEKVSRQTNAPARPRAVSPGHSGEQSAIPLFNSSRKSTKTETRSTNPAAIALLAGGLPTGDDPRQEEEQLDLVEQLSAENGSVAPKKKSLKDKVNAAKDRMKLHERKGKEPKLSRGLTRGKSNVLGGVDYLKLHEKKLGGMKKKMR